MSLTRGEDTEVLPAKFAAAALSSFRLALLEAHWGHRAGQLHQFAPHRGVRKAALVGLPSGVHYAHHVLIDQRVGQVGVCRAGTGPGVTCSATKSSRSPVMPPARRCRVRGKRARRWRCWSVMMSKVCGGGPQQSASVTSGLRRRAARARARASLGDQSSVPWARPSFSRLCFVLRATASTTSGSWNCPSTGET